MRSLKQNAAARRSFPDLLKLGSNIVGRVIDLYILNRLKRDEIHNDPGASFTRIERLGNKITKRAMPQGEEKLRDEIEWTVKFLNTPFKTFLPHLYDYSTEPGNVYYTMKYYDFANLRAVITLDMNADYFLRKRWRHLFDRLLRYMWTEKNSSVPEPDFFEQTHHRKYRKRMAMAREMAPFMDPIVGRDAIQINGRTYLSPDLLINYVADDEKMRDALTPERVYISHGDIHTNNILCGLKATRMILLDCRGRAPDGNYHFDVAYDIAKIYHDLRSLYSLIERHHYSIFVVQEPDAISIDLRFTQEGLVDRFRRNYQWVEQIISSFAEQFGNLRYRADFTEAMLYLTMVPLHLKERSEGLVCLLTGIMRLNEWMQRYHREAFERLAAGIVSEKAIAEWRTGT